MNKQLNFEEIRADAQARIAAIGTNRSPIALLCDGLSDAQNIGAMFRIADAARLEKIYFFGTAVDVSDKKLQKVARATQQYVPFAYLNTPSEVAALKAAYHIIALDKTSESRPYTQFRVLQPLEKKILLLLGAEKFGVSQPLLDLADATIHLPMLGVNTSMNVSVATGIAVYHLLAQVSPCD